MNTMQHIEDFLGQKRLAIVGVSQNPQDFSRTMLREFRDRGYDAVPVNPATREIDGKPCFARVQEIDPPVENVLLMTSPAVSGTVVQDCFEAGVKRVWMYRATGAGAVSDEAMDFCESKEMTVIPGECPLMFLPGGSWFHKAHGWVRKITGAYPR